MSGKPAPGAALAASAVSAPPQPASKAPHVFGILSVVFGSFLLLMGLFASIFIVVGPVLGTIGGMIPDDAPNRAMGLQVVETIGTVYTAYGYQGLLLAVMSGALLAVGIGQLRYRRWAAQASVVWGIAGLVAVVGMVLLFWVVIGPAFEQVFETAARADPRGQVPPELGRFMRVLIGASSGIGALIFYSPYPILMIVFFRKNHVRAAMIR